MDETFLESYPNPHPHPHPHSPSRSESDGGEPSGQQLTDSPLAIQTLYVPIVSPPTPAPSPRLLSAAFLPPPSPAPSPAPLNPYPPTSPDPLPSSSSASDALSPTTLLSAFASLPPAARRTLLSALPAHCTPSELLYLSTALAPRLVRDFLADLPAELALHVLAFVEEHRTLARAGQVSRAWRSLVRDEGHWRRLCRSYAFVPEHDELAQDDAYGHRRPPDPSFSYRRFFRAEFTTATNWRRGGRLLRAHRVQLQKPTPPTAPTSSPSLSSSSSLSLAAPAVPPVAIAAVPSPDLGVVTSVAVDADWVVVGLASARVHVFSARTGALARTLTGHWSGVWAVWLVSAGGVEICPRRSSSRTRAAKSADSGGALGLELFDDMTIEDSGLEAVIDEDEEEDLGKPSDVCQASDGWGQPNALVISGGCDKVVKVWDVETGRCVHTMPGHTSTIRCIKVLHGTPIAVSGSRDCTLRVWDVRAGRALRVLAGHEGSVRCLDVCGRKVVSGSYDCTARIWDVDTGECLHVLRGHYHQLYAVAFDGVRVASGGLDTTVRVWDAGSGQCVALLQGHTALVCQLQLSPTTLATGGSDGRVITFSLPPRHRHHPSTVSQGDFVVQQRLAAHDSSVTALQFDSRFLVTGGNDGRVRLFDARTGSYIRELSASCESVWKVAFRADTLVVTCKRAGRTVMEIWSFRGR